MATFTPFANQKLKVTFYDGGSGKKEVLSRNNFLYKVKTAIRQLLGVLWKPRMSKSTKIRVYNATAESVSLYCAEVWEFTELKVT